ncbi:granzyme B-like [Octodon degus]|uniref:Granzyme B-like n=1 Tax=Octodon degus TaxID=10160 RepID=A0A6P3FYH3_OCTDE|nr:granzyme B-like [Octodon degus]
MQLLLLLLAFFLPPRTRAGEIFGGHEAKPHSRPYMAFLRLRNTTSVWRCGGFMIHEKFVLTAAHCMERPLHSQGRQIKVILGAHNIKKTEKTQQVIQVKKNIPHPQYNPEKLINDIMLLQLEQKAKVTKEVQIIKLPKAKTWVKPGTRCQVAGWGLLAPNGTLPDTLHEVQMTVQEDKVCQKRFRNYDSAIQICAGDPNTLRGSFEGDSGGPFMCKNVVQAIVSYGVKYEENKHGPNPHVYTKLSPYLAWIEKTMKQYLIQEANEATLSSVLSWT